MHVSIHGSFTFILTSINRHSMSLDKWVKILLDFNKETSMLIKNFSTHRQKWLPFGTLYASKCTSPVPQPLPAFLAVFLWLCVYKVWNSLKSLRSGSLVKTNRSYLGLFLLPHLHSFCAKGQGMSELVAVSQAQHGIALIYQCSCFPISEHASIYFS